MFGSAYQPALTKNPGAAGDRLRIMVLIASRTSERCSAGDQQCGVRASSIDEDRRRVLAEAARQLDGVVVSFAVSNSPQIGGGGGGGGGKKPFL